ncbi:MAG TPA: response regulator [Stellaceae bacterium]|nr:response regulator [Stellaceae bacterium]
MRHSLAEQLQKLHEEFSAAQVETGAEALDVTKREHFDAIVLDVGLPDMDGRELCRLMRRGGVRAPILMLTGANTDADAILGLDSGANHVGLFFGKEGRDEALKSRTQIQL